MNNSRRLLYTRILAIILALNVIIANFTIINLRTDDDILNIFIIVCMSLITLNQVYLIGREEKDSDHEPSKD